MRWPLHCRSAAKGEFLIQGHRQCVILRYHADEGQTCLVHGVVNGGVHTVQQFFAPGSPPDARPAEPNCRSSITVCWASRREASCVVTTHAAVCTADRQPEAPPAPALPVCPADRSQTAALDLSASAESPPLSQQAPHSYSRRQQIEIGILGCATTAASSGRRSSHIGEIHQRPVRQTQGQIQISQSDVAVHAQHPLAALEQRGADSGSREGRSYRCRSRWTLPRYIVRSRHHLTFKCQYPYYNGFFLIFCKWSGIFFGVSAIFIKSPDGPPLCRGSGSRPSAPPVRPRS